MNEPWLSFDFGSVAASVVVAVVVVVEVVATVVVVKRIKFLN